MTTDQEFEDFYVANLDAVFRACFLLARNREIAEDAAHEAFARGLARWDRLRDQPWAAGWVMTTALNCVRRSFRYRLLAHTRESEERDLDLATDVERAVRRLPSRQQTAVLLYYGNDLTVRDVAAAMQCSEGTVKAHLSKARGALATTLEEVRLHE